MCIFFVVVIIMFCSSFSLTQFALLDWSSNMATPTGKGKGKGQPKGRDNGKGQGKDKRGYEEDWLLAQRAEQLQMQQQQQHRAVPVCCCAIM